MVDLQTEKRYKFVANRWVSIDKTNSTLYYTLTPHNEEELKNFLYIFRSKSMNDFSDRHLWFSIFNRPSKSNFTSCQRLSVAVSALFCVMTSSLMYFQNTPRVSVAVENKGVFHFTLQKVMLLFENTNFVQEI